MANRMRQKSVTEQDLFVATLRQVRHGTQQSPRRMPSRGITRDTRGHGHDGIRVTLSHDQAYELAIDVATGSINDVLRIASTREAGTEQC